MPVLLSGMPQRINRERAEADCLQVYREREGRDPTPAELSKAVSAYLRGFRETDRVIGRGKRR